MLNDAKVRAAKPREKTYKLTNSNRLFLLATPGGGQLWRWNYSNDGKQKSVSFGIYPMVALVTTREKRDGAHAILAEGRDPSIVKKAANRGKYRSEPEYLRTGRARVACYVQAAMGGRSRC